MVENNLALNAIDVPRSFVFFRKLINHFEEAFRSRSHSGGRPHHIREVLDRRKQEQHRREERRELADCEYACLRLKQRKHHDDGNAAHGDQLGQRRARRLDLLSLQRQILEELIDLRKV